MILDPVRVNRKGKIACTAIAKLPPIMRNPKPRGVPQVASIALAYGRRMFSE
jgi:hypothetical protein